jgi:integrase
VVLWWYSDDLLLRAMPPIDPVPTAALIVCEQRGEAYYEAKFRYGGRQVKRRIGPAWLTRDTSGAWVPRRGRVADGYLDDRRAHVAAAELVRGYVTDFNEADRVERERRTRGVTFREVAHGYLGWLEVVRGAKPSTIRSHQSDLAEPGTRHKRGEGVTAGHIMAALGDRPAAQITPAEVEALLRTVAAAGVSARTVNRTREIVCAAFNYGMKPTTYSLPTNPALGTDRRRVPEPGVLLFYSPEEIEAIARSLAAGFHRPAVSARGELEHFEDQRDSEAVRVAAYSGLRLGELLALRWRDVDWTGSALTISHSLSSGVEGTTKTGHVRRVPMADQAAAALDRLSQRDDFVSPDDYVFCNALGRPLDGSALRRRYKRARDAAGLRPLRWHDLRHTFGSLLVAGGVDIVSVKDAMGHSQLTTTSRYLHARPATERPAAFTAAFGGSANTASYPRRRDSFEEPAEP